LHSQILPALTTIEIVIVMLAVAIDSLVIAWFSEALHRKVAENQVKGWPVYFTLFRLVFVVAGITGGKLFAGLLPDNHFFAGLAIVAVMGLKMGVESFGFREEEKVILIDSIKTLVVLSTASGINTLLVGLGLGLIGTGLYVPVVVTAVSVVVFTSIGSIIGKKAGYKPFIRYFSLVGGLIIVAISLGLLLTNFLI